MNKALSRARCLCARMYGTCYIAAAGMRREQAPIPCSNFIVLAIHLSPKSIQIQCVPLPPGALVRCLSPAARRGKALPPRGSTQMPWMHTITTLTSDEQWIWPVSPRPGAMELLLASGVLQPGRLQSLAIDDGPRSPLTGLRPTDWSPKTWGPTISGHRFWIFHYFL